MNLRFRTVKQFQDIALYFVLHSKWLDCPGIESRWGDILRNLSDRSWGPHSFLYNGYGISRG